MDNIKISELSVTKQNLQRIADEIKVKLEIAEKMACTDETKQAVKKYRADLKKEFEELENERKEKTKEYEKPLKDFKAMYDDFITIPFKTADIALKQKIDDVENAMRDRKKAAVEVYATELLQAYSLEWVDPLRIVPHITLSASEKSLKKEVKEEADRIKSEVDCINTISDNSELMAEYMNCLNLAEAKMTVIERQHAIEAAEKAKAAYNQQEGLDREVEKRVEQLAPPTIVSEQEEKTYSMTFTVSGTIEQLKALKAFMLENNIIFANGGTEK